MHGIKKEHVDALHVNILSVVRNNSNGSFQVVSSSHGNAWHNQPAGVRISFELGVLPSQPPGIVHDYIDRSMGGRSFAFKLGKEPDDEPTVWAGWYEEWEVEKGGLFNLVALSWTFYWGVYARNRPNILRADWDSLKYRNKLAAQPHWHVDPPMFAEPFGQIKRWPATQLSQTETPASDAPDRAENLLEELPPLQVGVTEVGAEQAKIHLLYLEGMHLGMGGWQHGKEHPGCWRQTMPAKWVDIKTWAENTLIYAKEQFAKEFYSPEM